MPKQKLQEFRRGWSGGLNLGPLDTLAPNELANATNARLREGGAIERRGGSRRLHQNALADDVLGVFQWDAPAGKELVCVSNTDFHHKTSEFGAWTTETAAFSTNVDHRVHFFPFRGDGVSAALKLVIVQQTGAATGIAYTWDGTTLTQIDGSNSIPSHPYLGIPYHTRAFYVDLTQPKHLQWTNIGDATDATGTGIDGGGVALVDLLTGETINGLMVIGSSLIVSTEDSLVRFTGYSTEDIKVQQDTEGVSSQLGVVGSRAFTIADGVGIGLTDRGVIAILEEGARFISGGLGPRLRNLNRSVLNRTSMVYHRGRREVLMSVEDDVIGDTDTTSIYAWRSDMNAWMGPWTYGFAIRDLARYEDPNGDEHVVAACEDGFVRQLDIVSLTPQDDVLWDGSGGSDITMTMTLPPIFGDVGPGVEKLWDRIKVQATAITDSAITFGHQMDAGGFTDEPAIVGGSGAVKSYDIDFKAQGDRLDLRFTDASSKYVLIHGFQLFGYNMQRVH